MPEDNPSHHWVNDETLTLCDPISHIDSAAPSTRSEVTTDQLNTVTVLPVSTRASGSGPGIRLACSETGPTKEQVWKLASLLKPALDELTTTATGHSDTWTAHAASKLKSHWEAQANDSEISMHVNFCSLSQEFDDALSAGTEIKSDYQLSLPWVGISPRKMETWTPDERKKWLKMLRQGYGDEDDPHYRSIGFIPEQAMLDVIPTLHSRMPCGWNNQLAMDRTRRAPVVICKYVNVVLGEKLATRPETAQGPRRLSVKTASSDADIHGEGHSYFFLGSDKGVCHPYRTSPPKDLQFDVDVYPDEATLTQHLDFKEVLSDKTQYWGN